MPSILGSAATRRNRQPLKIEEPSATRMLIYLFIIVVGAIWNFVKRQAAESSTEL